MVLAVKVGRPRSPWHVLLLSAATFGVYWFYWAYRAHDEAYRQFELAREGRDEGVAWIVFGNFLPFLRYIYYYRFVANVLYLRQRFGFARSLTPGGYLGLSLTAGAVFTALALPSLIMIEFAFDLSGDGELESPGLLATGLVLGSVAAVQWLVLKAMALHRLQSDLNEVWAAYDNRAAFIRTARRPAGVAAAQAGVAGPRGGAPVGAAPGAARDWPIPR